MTALRLIRLHLCPELGDRNGQEIAFLVSVVYNCSSTAVPVSVYESPVRLRGQRFLWKANNSGHPLNEAFEQKHLIFGGTNRTKT